MIFGMVNKSRTVNRFVLHTLQRNITHLAIITRKTNKKLGNLEGGNSKGAKITKLNVEKISRCFKKNCVTVFSPVQDATIF